MGSPITLSGFNNIDFSVILNAIMTQERAPVTALQTQQTTFRSQKTSFGTLASKLSALENAASALAADDAFGGRQTTVSDTSAIAVATGGTTPVGAYEVVVQHLARAQVTGTTSTHADRDTTVVASGGTLTIGDVDVTLTGDVTLDELASAINATDDIGATATVVKNGNNYQLVLTGNETGEAGAFAIANGLTGGTGFALGTTNAVDAQDAQITVNNITATSSTNSFESVIAGSTLTVYKENASNPLTVLVSSDSSGVKGKAESFVSAYNDLNSFLTSQSSSAAAGSVGRDPLVRGLRASLTSVISSTFSVGGDYANLAEIGFEFTRTGELKLSAATFDEALSSNKADLERLFTGDGGAFAAFASAVEQYTDAGGLIPTIQSRLDTQLSTITKRISDFEARLEIRRQALQREFIAADQAMSQLNTQKSQLSSIGGEFRLF